MCIKSLGDYIDEITQIGDVLKCDAENDEALYFRGQSNEQFELLPAIARHRGLIDSERELIERSKLALPSLFANIKSPIELLALLQHHGMPTRLLDVTTNPLVALYFACFEKDNRNTNGEVIVFKENKYDISIYPIHNAIADSYRFAFGTSVNLKTFYEKVNRQPYFLEQYLIKENGCEDWIKKCCNSERMPCLSSWTRRTRWRRSRTSVVYQP